MSLIHDALQKAQKDAVSASKIPGTSMFAPPPEKKPIPKRTIVLAVVLIVVVGFFAYMRLAPKDKVVSPDLGGAKPIDVKTTYGKQDIGLLKKRAIDAYKTDDFDTAWSSLSAASALDVNDPEIWNNLGLVAKKRDDSDKAREYYQKALDLKPTYVEAMNNMAILEWEGENLTRATELLSKALEISAAYPEANFHMGLIYDEKGNKQKAAEYYKRFLDVAGTFPSNIVDSVRDRLMEIGE